jgi:hypothetical protein
VCVAEKQGAALFACGAFPLFLVTHLEGSLKSKTILFAGKSAKLTEGCRSSFRPLRENATLTEGWVVETRGSLISFQRARPLRESARVCRRNERSAALCPRRFFSVAWLDFLLPLLRIYNCGIPKATSRCTIWLDPTVEIRVTLGNKVDDG